MNYHVYFTTILVMLTSSIVLPHVKQEMFTLPGHLGSTPIFSEVRVARSVQCFVDHCLSCSAFSFGHCIICTSSIYGSMITLLISLNFFYISIQQNIQTFPSCSLSSVVSVLFSSDFMSSPIKTLSFDLLLQTLGRLSHIFINNFASSV